MVIQLRDIEPGVTNCDGCREVRRVAGFKVGSRYGSYLCSDCLRELARDLDRLDGR